MSDQLVQGLDCLTDLIESQLTSQIKHTC